MSPAHRQDGAVLRQMSPPNGLSEERLSGSSPISPFRIGAPIGFPGPVMEFGDAIGAATEGAARRLRSVMRIGGGVRCFESPMRSGASDPGLRFAAAIRAATVKEQPGV